MTSFQSFVHVPMKLDDVARSVASMGSKSILFFITEIDRYAEDYELTRMIFDWADGELQSEED